MIIRAILPKWAVSKYPDRKEVIEGVYTDKKIEELCLDYYNVYFFPNYPLKYDSSKIINGSVIDTFTHVFVDMDLKDGTYPDKESFVSKLKEFKFKPSLIVDSGNGVHAYWPVTDLDAMNHLKLQRRLIRHFKTDETISKICQLMRVPETLNTKDPDNLKACTTLEKNDVKYTCDELDSALPLLTPKDFQYVVNHFNMSYHINDIRSTVKYELPVKFGKLLKSNKEVEEIWKGNVDDRSKSDYRIAHIMLANNFTKNEALSVLVNSGKALARGPDHRFTYANNIVEKIWTCEDKDLLDLSSSVEDILENHGDNLKGTRFPCYTWLDNTVHGFRLGQVIGLVAGSGVGKTAIALNMFLGFVQSNPEYDHFFIPLEQPTNEIADRWKNLCQGNTLLHKKVHLISNYDKDGNFRNLSLSDIQEYIMKFKKTTGKKVGCVVIDHIGALASNDKEGQCEGLAKTCHKMKAFAIQTNTMLIMQSQAPREKAGIGDLEINKDAAYGTVFFESYCDYLITLWQPVKRCYVTEGCPAVTAFKFCKIRHKKQNLDVIKEDVRYMMLFDSKTERLREMTQDEEVSFNFFNNTATSLRKLDRKTDLLEYTAIRALQPGESAIKYDNGKTSNSENPS